MNAERWQRLKLLYQSAMDLATAHRRKYVAALPSFETASDLRNLLSEQDKLGSFLEPGTPIPVPSGDVEAINEVLIPEDGNCKKNVPQPRREDGSTLMLRAFSAGEVIAERFRIVRFIAHGGMGDVYEAEDLAQMRSPHVALKTIRPEIASNSRSVVDFEREIAIGKTITHQNVCRIYDMGLHRDTSAETREPPIKFLTMELLKGPTLAERLQQVKFMELSEALPLIRQIADGLSAAHQAHVVHRDLKPGNIILAASRAPSGYRAVITDFGLATQFADLDCTVSLTEAGAAGTPDYMSPEQIMGKPLSPASDIYSFGVVVYRMMTGKLPFEGENWRARMVKRLQEAPVPPRTHVDLLPQLWQTAILRCLEREPANRFATVLDLPRVLEGEVHYAFTPLKRRRTLVTAVCVTAGSAAVWTGWRTWTSSGGQPGQEAARLYQLGLNNVHAGAYFAATKALEQAVHLAPAFSPARARLAESWFELDLPERAAREFLPIRRQDNSALSKLDRLQIEAVDLTITREFEAAVKKYEEMLQQTRVSSADLNVDLGRSYEKAGKPDKAIAAYRRAAEGPLHSPAAWLRLAVLYSRSSQTAPSEQAFAEADRLYRLTSNLEGLTEVALQNGVAANNRAQLIRAAAFLQKAVQLAQDAGNLQQEISARLTLANTEYVAGNSTIAETYAREALHTAQANQMEVLTVRGFVNLGNAYLRKGDLPGAQQHLQDALALARRTNSPRLSALCLLALASLHDRLNQSADQIREANEALEYYQRNRWVQQSFQCMTLIGRGELDLGNYPAALNSFRRLLTDAEKAGDLGQQMVAQENLGDALFGGEQYPQALEHYQAFLHSSTSMEKKAYAAFECGKTLWRLGEYAEANVHFSDAADQGRKFPQLQLSLARSKAEMLVSQKRWQEAVLTIERTLVADDGKTSLMRVASLRILGTAWLRSGKIDVGYNKCEEALNLAEDLKDSATLREARLAALESRVAARLPTAALKVFHDLEPALETHPESRWRALAMLSRFYPEYLDPARRAIHELASQWGNDRFKKYILRKDLLKISRSLLYSYSTSN